MPPQPGQIPKPWGGDFCLGKGPRPQVYPCAVETRLVPTCDLPQDLILAYPGVGGRKSFPTASSLLLASRQLPQPLRGCSLLSRSEDQKLSRKAVLLLCAGLSPTLNMCPCQQLFLITVAVDKLHYICLPPQERLSHTHKPSPSLLITWPTVASYCGTLCQACPLWGAIWAVSSFLGYK